MLRTVRALGAAVCLFVMLPLSGAAEDKKDDMMENPMYAVWANFKPGATATVVEKTTYSGDKNLIPDEKVVTYTLVNVTPERVVVRAVVVEKELLGTVESAPTRHAYPAKLKKSYLAVAAPELMLEKGEDTIKWNGKEMKCQTLSGSYKKDGDVVEIKAWTNEKVPGGVVRRTRTTKQKDDTITTTVTLRAYSAGK